MDAYRRVYYLAPTSNRADAAVVAVAELLAEQGRNFKDEKSLQDAIGQYEFLRREYPGSKYRVEALFTIGQIYREDLNDNAQAKETFEEFLKHYPNADSADDARQALSEIDDAANGKANPPKKHRHNPPRMQSLSASRSMPGYRAFKTSYTGAAATGTEDDGSRRRRAG